MFSSSDLFFFTFVFFLSLELSVGRLPPQPVSSCSALRRALGSQSVSTIEVSGEFVCDTSKWRRPVVINRDLNVTGMTSNGVLPQINWLRSSKGVVAGTGIQLVFYNLVLLQESMGIGGFDLPFLESRMNSTSYFLSVVIGVESCPHSLEQERVESLPRPGRRPGSQDSSQLDPDAILIKDIAISWSGRNAIWQFFDTVLTCNIYKNDPVLREYYHLIEGESELNNDLEGTTGLMSDQNPQSSDDIGGGLIAVITIFSSALVLTIALLVFLARKRSRKTPYNSETNSFHSTIEVEEHDKTGAPEVWNLLDSDISLEAPLGRGEFGKVYKASWQGTTVAVKIIKHNDQSLKTNVGGLFEAFIAKHISHPNVVQTYQISTKHPPSSPPTRDRISQSDSEVPGKDSRTESGSSEEMFGCFDDQDSRSCVNGTRYETWIILEYCDGESLAQAISKGEFLVQDKNTPGFKMQNIARTALEIAGAMNYLHSLRIIHGDLKPGNVLLKKDASDPRGFTCKVGDFGLSKFLAEDSHIETFTCGTVTHMPPELLHEGKLSSASDVYSFGILLWEILTGKKPFVGKNQPEIILSVVNKQMRPPLPSNIPKDLSELIQSCWKQDYTERPTFPQIIDSLTKILANCKKLKGLGSGSKSNLVNPSAIPRSTFFTPQDQGDLEAAGWRRRSFQLISKRFGVKGRWLGRDRSSVDGSSLDRRRSLQFTVGSRHPILDQSTSTLVLGSTEGMESVKEVGIELPVPQSHPLEAPRRVQECFQ